VKDGRGVEPDVAARREAGDGAAAIDHCRDITFRDAAMAVGAGGDKQRRIVGIDGIEMDAQRDHAVEQGLRWGDMVQARLYGPGTKASCFYPFAHGDSAVLMPAERPIGGLAFIEEDGADGFCGLAQMGGGMAADGSGRREEWRQFCKSCQALARTVCW